MADASDAWLLGFRLMQAQAGVAPTVGGDMDARLLQAARELRRKPKLDDGDDGDGGLELAPRPEGAPSYPKAPEPQESHHVEVAASSTPQLASIPRVVVRRKAMRRDRGEQGL